MADDRMDELTRFEERTEKRRAKAKEQNAEAEEMIREAEERRRKNKPAE